MAFPALQEEALDPPLSAVDPEADARLAREVAEQHRKGKERRRFRDLTAEKYLIHVDGEGDAQWADVLDGSRIKIPVAIGGSIRRQENLLRPMLQNMVSFHTAIPFRALAIASADRKARARARIDTALANHTIQHQGYNPLFSEALNFAGVYGHCLVHQVWRNDLTIDPYAPLYLNLDAQDPLSGVIRRGFVDAWVGDPWDTVYAEGSTRRSVHSYTYGRSLPTAMVKRVFAHVPGIEALGGNTNLPNSARFQRIVRSWSNLGGPSHGTSAINGGDRGGEEITAILCREVAPGVEADWPRGRLTIVALDGTASTDDGMGGNRFGNAIKLHDGPLPGGRFSATRVYALPWFDDVLGKAYVADLDDLQVRLNQLISLREERIRRFSRPPLLAQAGTLEDDTLTTIDDAIIYYSGEMPRFLEGAMFDPGTEAAIRDTKDAMFRIGGWQAASRGEANAADAAAKVVALARADDSIFGPANRDIQGAICEALQVAHALHREFMTVPMLLEVAGSDIGHLAEPWIEAKDLSPEPPQYVLTQGYASPEARAQQLLSLVGQVGADGQPLMSTEQFWESFPEPSLRPLASEANRIRRTRPHAINSMIESAVRVFRENAGDIGPEATEPAAQMVHQTLGMDPATANDYRLLRTDDPQTHIDALDELVADASADPIVRRAAELRQDLYWQWMAQMAMQQQAMTQQAGAQQAQPGGQEQQAQPTAQGFQPQAGGTPTSNMMASPGEVQDLTQAAATG